mgnify:FL=1
MMLAIRRDMNSEEIRRFGWTVGGAFGVLALLCAWRSPGFEVAASPWWLGVVVCGAAAVTFVGVCSASVESGRRLYHGWMRLGLAMGKVTSIVILTVLFCTVLPVFSLIRLGDPLRLRRSNAHSFWEEPSPHEPTLERAARPF